MLTSSQVCPTKAFFVLVGDHGINAVPQPRPRPGGCCPAAVRTSEQFRVENPTIDIDPPPNCNTAARPFLGMESSSVTSSERDVTDEVVGNTDISHPLLHDSLHGICIPDGKIHCLRHRVCLGSKCAVHGALAFSRSSNCRRVAAAS